MNKPTVEYNKGNNQNTVAFVFACPGQKEMQQGRVVAGKTGENLNTLLHILSNSSPLLHSLFPTSDRYYYRITNASNLVHYPALNAVSVPHKREYLTDVNVQRILSELSGSTLVLAFGQQARELMMYVADNFSVNFSIVYLPHLSLLSLNQIPFTVDGRRIERGEKDATVRRLEVVAIKIQDAVEK